MTAFEVLTMGRIGVDLYPQQVGVGLDELSELLGLEELVEAEPHLLLLAPELAGERARQGQVGVEEVQDATAGIDLFSTSLSPAFNIGDNVEATGTVTQFNGLTELTVTAVSFRSTWDKVCQSVEYVVQWGIEHRQLAPPACSGGRLELVRGVDDALHGVFKLP